MVVPLLNEILLTLKNLKHLELDLTSCFYRPELYRSVLRTLSQCPFALQSYESYVGSDAELIRFLSRQPSIEFFGIKGAVLDMPEWTLPQDVLPRLKYLQTDDDFYLSALHAPRMVTHLDVSALPIDEDQLHDILQNVGKQLVSFKYARDSLPPFPIDQPVDILRGGALPKLKFLELGDFMERGVCLDILVYPSC